MRPTYLLAIATMSSAMSTSAGAQARPDSRDAEPAIAPAPRVRLFGSADEPGQRAALGVGTSTTGTARDTLGLMITSVVQGGPAERAGLEEGNRIVSINGVSLRGSRSDLEDQRAAGTLVRRLSRELARVKPGAEVDLGVYREGRLQSVRVRTAHSDSLFRRSADMARVTRIARADVDDRPALGFSLGSTGSRRDTLGVLVMGVPDSTPAARAGLEEGHRIAAINGVNLRVAREDAGDAHAGAAKAQRLRREIGRLKPGEEVTLKVYANGQLRDVTMKVARAGDLPRSPSFFFGSGGPDMPIIPAMPRPPLPPMMPRPRGEPMSLEVHPGLIDEMRRSMREARVEVQRLRPEMERLRPEMERLRPEMERMRRELPRMMERIRVPDVQVDVDLPPRSSIAL